MNETTNKKQVRTSEFVLYLMGVFFYTTMSGMLNANRSAYLVNVIHLEPHQTAFFNAITAIVPFILNFFAHSLMVAPLVSTSSTNNTVL